MREGGLSLHSTTVLAARLFAHDGYILPNEDIVISKLLRHPDERKEREKKFHHIIRLSMLEGLQARSIAARHRLLYFRR